MSVPKLRFRADDGTEFPEWKEKTFSEILSENKIPIPKPTNGYERLGIRSHGKGTFHEYVPTGEGLDVDTMYIVEAHNLILNITFAWEQAITITDDDDNGKLVSHRFPQYKFKDGFDWHYFKYDILDKKLKHELGLASPGGAGRNRVLNKSAFLKIKRIVPCLEEQQKIASFLSMIDEIIQSTDSELTAWQERKKGVMQKLFSQEVRFKADDGSDFPDWEEKTLGDICVYERQCSEGANFVGTENMLKDFGGVTFDNSNADGSGTLYHPGDTLMSNIRPYLKKAWLADRKGTCSTDVLVFHPTSVEPGYLYWLIASDAFVRYVMSAAKGSKMPRGDKKHIMEMPLLLPNKDEQRKIDDCLSSLNGVIIKAKNELAKWQELKKGLLQQMFV